MKLTKNKFNMWYRVHVYLWCSQDKPDLAKAQFLLRANYVVFIVTFRLLTSTGIT